MAEGFATRNTLAHSDLTQHAAEGHAKELAPIFVAIAAGLCLVLYLQIAIT